MIISVYQIIFDLVTCEMSHYITLWYRYISNYYTSDKRDFSYSILCYVFLNYITWLLPCMTGVCEFVQSTAFVIKITVKVSMIDHAHAIHIRMDYTTNLKFKRHLPWSARMLWHHASLSTIYLRCRPFNESAQQLAQHCFPCVRPHFVVYTKLRIFSVA